jgi:hypothetical protein
MDDLASNEVSSFELLSAEKQVVAGMNYFLTLEVKMTNRCELHSVQVYDRFGDMRVTSRTVAPCP